MNIAILTRRSKTPTVDRISSKYANFVSTSLVSMDCTGQATKCN